MRKESSKESYEQDIILDSGSADVNTTALCTLWGGPSKDM